MVLYWVIEISIFFIILFFLNLAFNEYFSKHKEELKIIFIKTIIQGIIIYLIMWLLNIVFY